MLEVIWKSNSRLSYRLIFGRLERETIPRRDGRKTTSTLRHYRFARECCRVFTVATTDARGSAPVANYADGDFKGHLQ